MAGRSQTSFAKRPCSAVRLFGVVARRPGGFFNEVATAGVSRDHTLPSGLRHTLDGYEIGRAFDRDCPSCGQEYTPGDRLVVRAERDAAAMVWDAISVVCAECGERSLHADGDAEAIERALVGIDLVTAPMTRVLDGDSAELLDHVPAREAEE